MAGRLTPALPTLRTARLVLRPFVLADATEVQRLAGAVEVASTTQNIPHPYADGLAETWIGTHLSSFERGERLTLAITNEGNLVGAVGLGLVPTHRRAELGYWIGLTSWGRGYATEAAAAVIEYGFDQLMLHRIEATHLTRNPASGRVMVKLGMRLEGVLRGHVWKDGRPEDLARYAILRSDSRPPGKAAAN